MVFASVRLCTDDGGGLSKDSVALRKRDFHVTMKLFLPAIITGYSKAFGICALFKVGFKKLLARMVDYFG